MTISFFLYFYIGSLLVSFLFGSSYMLPMYMHMLNGSEINMGWFLLTMGIGSLFSTMTLNKILLRFFTSLTVINFGILAYGIGLLLLANITHIHYVYSIGFIMGIGWGLIYVASVMTLATNISANQRKNHFSYLAAINALGAGLAPIIFQFLNHVGVNIKQIYFMEGSSVCAITIIIFENAKRLRIQQAAFVSHVIMPLNKLFSREYTITCCAILMALLYACVFTTLTFFQVIFADLNHVNYATFFSIITITIIFSRLTLIHWITAYQDILLYLSLLFSLAIILFLFIDNYYLYILSALLFGLSYGLIFPIVQALSIAYVDSYYQDAVIRYFSIGYFIGIFGFPLISASIIYYLNYKAIITLLIFIASVCTILSVTLKTVYKTGLLYES